VEENLLRKTSLALMSVVLLGVTRPSSAAAQEKPPALHLLDLVRTDQPPKIDGVLDDAAWSGSPLELSDWVTYSPVRGQALDQRTAVRVTYDDAGIFIAFQCKDPEPDKVRATMGRRDQLWSDDWVGLSLDAIGNGQQSYDLFVNPLGVQADILDTSTAGEDTAPDWVWESAGRKTDEGYDVEIHVPWKSLRFRSGEDVKMGILFWRRVSRTGVSASWPELPAGKWVFECHAPMRLKNLPRPLSLELVPSATYARNEERTSPTAFGKAENEPEAGFSVKYGVTSTSTVEATVNPDFSQVESDAFQVEVNQRYPNFYSEKRPFFMEGMGTFQLAGTGGDAMMSTAVHTRRIVDPIWGGKAAGSLGRVSFAGLAASDTAPGRAPDVDPSLEDDDRLFLIGRATWSLGKSNYFGVLGTQTQFGSGHNRVFGGDTSLRRGAHSLNATLLGSDSVPSLGGETKRGAAAQGTYSYDTKRWTFISQTEHYTDFQMDTAFLKQTGITSNWSYGQLSLYPNEKKHPWFKRFSTFVFGRAGRDRVQEGDVYFGLVGVRANFTRQGYLRLDAGWGQEPWVGHEFQTDMARIMGEVQLFRWLSLNAYMNRSTSVYYDEQDPFTGPSWYHSLGATFQPTSSLRLSASWERSQMSRGDDGEQVYLVDILNTRLSYQFDRRFSLRSIVRYDSAAAKVLTDFLASYEPVPGTVAYAGYGSLFEQRGWDGTTWLPNQGDYLVSRRGLFFKLSYAKRF
jgi:hypothetical protein